MDPMTLAMQSMMQGRRLPMPQQAPTGAPQAGGPPPPGGPPVPGGAPAPPQGMGQGPGPEQGGVAPPALPPPDARMPGPGQMAPDQVITSIVSKAKEILSQALNMMDPADEKADRLADVLRELDYILSEQSEGAGMAGMAGMAGAPGVMG